MVITPRELFVECLDKHYMLGAFNVFNLDSLSAVLAAAEAELSPVIVQVSNGTRKYIKNFPLFLDIIRLAIEYCTVPVLLQHDHCTKVEECIQAIESGIPAIMFDGSHLPFEQNVAETKSVVEYAHSKGVWVEAEIGCIPGFEDEIFSTDSINTDPVQAEEFVALTGCDALAVAVGTSHGGVLAEHSLPLAFDKLTAIHNVLPGFPLVIHGGASLTTSIIDNLNKYGGNLPYYRNVSEENIARCSEYGVCKVNMDVDNFIVYTTQIRKTLMEQTEKYDPRIYLRKGREAFEEQVRHKLKNVLHSSEQVINKNNERE